MGWSTSLLANEQATLPDALLDKLQRGLKAGVIGQFESRLEGTQWPMSW
jgi:hypothetical protein